MRKRIAIIMTLLLCISGTISHAIEMGKTVGPSPDPLSDMIVIDEVRTIVEVRELVLKTEEGDIPMHEDFRAYLRKGSWVAEETDLSRLAGRRATVHMINGKAAWVVIEVDRIPR